MTCENDGGSMEEDDLVLQQECNSEHLNCFTMFYLILNLYGLKHFFWFV